MTAREAHLIHAWGMLLPLQAMVTYAQGGSASPGGFLLLSLVTGGIFVAYVVIMMRAARVC